MKHFTRLLLAFWVITTSGRISAHVVNNHAKPHSVMVSDATPEHPTAGHLEHVDGKPAYYALLPLTIPADILASPFYLFFYIAFLITGDGP